MIGVFRVPRESLGILGALTNILLSICDHHWDIDTARGLMILCQAFYTNYSLKEPNESGSHPINMENPDLSHRVSNTQNKSMKYNIS
jgi:hypothetical protein